MSTGVQGPAPTQEPGDVAGAQEKKDKAKSQDLVSGAYINNLIDVLNEIIQSLESAAQAKDEDSSEKKVKGKAVKEALVMQENNEDSSTSLQNLQRDMAKLQKYAREANKEIGSNTDQDPKKLTKLLDNINSMIAKMQNDTLDSLSSLDPSLSPQIADVKDKLAAFTNQFSATLSDPNTSTIDKLKAFLTLYSSSQLPTGSGAKVGLAAHAASNAAGAAPPAKPASQTQEQSLWGAIEQWVFGDLMHNLSFGVSRYQWMVSLEAKGLGDLSKMVSEIGKWISELPTNFNVPASNSPHSHWTKFLAKLGELDKFKKSGLHTFYDNLKNEIASLRAHAHYTITTPKGGKVRKTLHSLTSMANGLSKKLKSFYHEVTKIASLTYGDFIRTKHSYYIASEEHHGSLTTTITKFSVHSMWSGNQKLFYTVSKRVRTKVTHWTTWSRRDHKGHLIKSGSAVSAVNNFHKICHSFFSAVKGDATTMQSLSNTGQANLRLELMYYQEFMQTAPQLIQTLNDLGKSITANLKGGN